MAIPVQAFLNELILRHRVVVIGGLAIIAHGYSRHTEDADIWLEPKISAAEWALAIEGVARKFPGTTLHRLPGWVRVEGAELIEAAEETGMIRVRGLATPLDIFRRPNEYDEIAFDDVVSRARLNSDGSHLPEPLDLIQTKLETNREKDQLDINFLEGLIRADYKLRLPAASFEEASAMLARYSEWAVLRAALENPDSRVRDLAMEHLQEFADAGDPFSLAILEGREVP